MKCAFCDVPSIGYHGNVTTTDLWKQLLNALNVFPEVNYTDRLNIHFARMGEPTFNEEVLDFAIQLAEDRRVLQEESHKRFETIHPVVSTMVPRHKNTFQYIQEWVDIKNRYYNGQAGLQLSINSTNEAQREEMFVCMAYDLSTISKQLENLPNPLGRKYTLNFALAEGYKVDGKKLLQLFDPEKWMVKITPIHNNTACRTNGIATNDGYQSFTPYKRAEESCQDAGFDTIVFIPSMDEEDGCVTCGNALLGQSKLNLKR
jgi:23S rRNA (adenine2503-C2)-methyltransferase